MHVCAVPSIAPNAQEQEALSPVLIKSVPVLCKSSWDSLRERFTVFFSISLLIFFLIFRCIGLYLVRYLLFTAREEKKRWKKERRGKEIGSELKTATIQGYFADGSVLGDRRRKPDSQVTLLGGLFATLKPRQLDLLQRQNLSRLHEPRVSFGVEADSVLLSLYAFLTSFIVCGFFVLQD